MHVEGVAAGGAVRPARLAERVAGHDGAEAVDEGAGEPGFDGREGDPATTEPQDTVGVDLDPLPTDRTTAPSHPTG